MASTGSKSRAPACSTYSPAPARSALRRCRAAPPIACSSRTTRTRAALIRENIEALGLTGASKLWRRDATKLGTAAPMQPFQLLFADPPYGKGLGELALAAAADGGWLSAGAVCVLEERADVEPAIPAAYALPR